jgi:preprotein translocase subunit YajC
MLRMVSAGVGNASTTSSLAKVVPMGSICSVSNLLLLADAAPEPQQQPYALVTTLLPFVVIGLLFYMLLIRPQRQEQAKRLAMLSGVKKNDRVITAGGIYGVVTNVHREADEVTVKVDESTNTKLRVTLSSITRILGEESSEDTASK